MYRSKSNFFFVFSTLAFLFITGVSLTIAVRRPVEKVIYLNKASEIIPEPGKVELKNELAPGFPEFPEYPGAKVVSSYTKEENGNIGHEAKLQVKGTVPMVMDWYVDMFENQGWEIEEYPDDSSIIGEQFLVARNKDSVLYLTVENEDRDEMVDIYAEFPVR